MTLLGTLALALGTSVAKYLAKELLPQDWQDNIASEVIGAGIGWLARPEPTDQSGNIIGQRVKAVYDLSSVPSNEKQATAFEVTRTLALAKTDRQQLAKLNLNSKRLYAALVENHPHATTQLSYDGEVLYRQMLRVAAEGIIETADQQPGFLPVAIGEMLERSQEQDKKIDQLIKLLGEDSETLKRNTTADQGREPISLIGYTQRLRFREVRLNLPGIPGTGEIQPSLDEIYIPLDQAFRDAIMSTPLLHIEDKAGAGKSTLLKKLILQDCDQFIAGQGDRIPLLLEARNLDLDSSQPLEIALLRRLSEREGLRFQELYSLFQLGKLVLIIDGLDEAEKLKRHNLIGAIRTSEAIWKSTGNQFIIAGRHLQRAGIQGFRKVGIERLSLAGAYQLIHNWRRYFEASALPMKSVNNLSMLSEHVNDLDATGENLDSMLTVPLYLTYIITIAANSESTKNISHLTRSKIGLYKRLLEQAIPYWETHKGSEGKDILGSPELPILAAYRTLFAIAFVLHSSSIKTNQLHLFEALITNCHDYLSDIAEEKILRSFNFWVNASVLRIASLEGAVEFWHHEMLEYCTARYLCANFPSPDDISDALASIVYQDSWQHVRNLYDAISRR